jgi:hypothetical protein
MAHECGEPNQTRLMLPNEVDDIAIEQLAGGNVRGRRSAQPAHRGPSADALIPA